MAIILNNKSVIFKDPVKPNADTMRWWAERGLILFENQRTGENGAQTVRDTLERLKGLNDMIGNHRSGKGWNMPNEMQEYKRYVDDMIVLCQTAREQGMPDDEKHARQLVEGFKQQRQSRMVVMPGMNSRF